MAKAIAIIAGLLGYSVAVKLYTLFKMMGIDVDNMEEAEIKNMLDEVLKDPQFKKYMR